ncbi:host specificity protein J [Burkholderia ubonensis]|uniref:host specificity protein J n=1 Tax=Burkholderia ubonensis TaxID=101571 RepID=UPI0009B457B5|nr:phage tail protein [Burkholderia ubonensis]
MIVEEERPIQSIRGASGGGSSSPTRTDDNLFSRDVVEIVLGLSQGPIRGLVDGMKSFYVGGTPLMSQDGSLNFSSFNLGVKLGTAHDSPVNYVLGGESSNTQVGTRLFQGTWVNRQTDQSLKGVIDQLQVRMQFNVLYVQNNDGSFNNTARFRIQYRPASSYAAWSEVQGGLIKVTGKTTSGYMVDYAWDVPRINDNWVIRVLKENPDASTTEFCDLTWESFQMVTKGNRSYNQVALLHLVAKATSQFSSIPDFAGIYDGLEILVPTNYNGDMHSYDASGPWNGTFKLAWTNNPAWILYNLIMNPTWGLAKYYPWITCNRFDFYDAGRWCDEMVPDGRGGWQPRYTFNLALTDQQTGLDILKYVAGSFGAVIFDDATGMVHLRVDRWEEPTLMFTPENVTPEGFSYTFTDMSTRYNDYEVQFVNPDIDWNVDHRRVPNEEHIALNGSIPYQFQAIGCTNEHEAVRRATYQLITSTTECATVSFVTARLGRVIDPYKPIYIADPITGWSSGGRIKSIFNNKIYLRDPIYFTVNQNYNLRLQSVDGLSNFVVTPGKIGAVTELTIVSGIIPPNIPDRTVFTIEDNGGFGIAKPFRTIAIEPVDNQPDTYKVTAVEVNINKQAAADNCVPIGSKQYSFKNPLIPPPPMNMVMASGTEQLIIGQDGSIQARILVSWDPPANAIVKRYDVQWKESSQSTWLTASTTGESVFLGPCKSGVDYDITVWAISTFDYRSSQLSTWNYRCVGKDEPPSNVTNFNVIRRQNDILLKWDPIPDLDRAGYEIRLGTSWETGTILVTDYAATQFAWTTDTGGAYSFMIRAIDTSHNFSPIPTIQTIALYGPSAVRGVIAVQSSNRIEMSWKPNPEDNILDYEIREGDSWATAVFVAKTKSTSFGLTAGAGGTRKFWLKAIAAPGIYSDKATFVTTDVAQLDNTNIVYETDELSKGFTGMRYNMVIYGDSLRMDDGKAKAEYIFSVSLPTSFRAQNTLFIGLDAIVDFTTRWKDATFPWNDAKAQMPWAAQGDISSINYRAEIATLTALPSDVLYAIKLDNTLGFSGPGDDGEATEQQTVSYRAGKYGSGLFVQTAPLQPVPTRVTFSVNIPNVFSTSFWIIPYDNNDDTWSSFCGRNGAQITIGYQASTMSVYAIDNNGKKISIPIDLEIGERYLVAISQDANTRTLYVGREGGSMFRGTLNVGGIGATINYSLY